MDREVLVKCEFCGQEFDLLKGKQVFVRKSNRKEVRHEELPVLRCPHCIEVGVNVTLFGSKIKSDDNPDLSHDMYKKLLKTNESCSSNNTKD